MAKYKNVKKLEYPTKVTLTQVLKGLWETSKTDTLFHCLMAILLITGLSIDLLGIFLGSWLLPIRRYIHGYLGTAFVIVFPIYLVKVIYVKKMRMLMTVVNYVDFVLYLILIISGIAIASVNQPWASTFPWLQSAFASFQFAPMVHTVTTYVWLLISIIFPGGFLHGIATSYIIWVQRGKKHE